MEIGKRNGETFEKLWKIINVWDSKRYDSPKQVMMHYSSAQNTRCVRTLAEIIS